MSSKLFDVGLKYRMFFTRHTGGNQSDDVNQILIKCFFNQLQQLEIIGMIFEITFRLKK